MFLSPTHKKQEGTSNAPMSMSMKFMTTVMETLHHHHSVKRFVAESWYLFFCNKSGFSIYFSEGYKLVQRLIPAPNTTELLSPVSRSGPGRRLAAGQPGARLSVETDLASRCYQCGEWGITKGSEKTSYYDLQFIASFYFL